MLGVSLVDNELRRSLSRAVEAIRQLRRCRVKGVLKPHKLVLLLAVIDLYEDGLVFGNRIYLNDNLERRFRFYFNMVAGPKDWCQIGPPFFHLRTSGFWFHKVHPNRALSYQALLTPGGGKGNVLRNIEYAYLSDYMTEVMIERETRQALREAIVDLLTRESTNPKAYQLRTARYKDESENV